MDYPGEGCGKRGIWPRVRKYRFVELFPMEHGRSIRQPPGPKNGEGHCDGRVRENRWLSRYFWDKIVIASGKR
jgi:hypothetical protein